MDWYIVVKTINGRRYRYRQMTWREGKRVRTRSEYLGPAGDEAPRPKDLSGAATIPIPFRREPDVDAALAIVLGPAAADFEIPWAVRRWGETEVALQPEITEVLDNLNVKWTRNAKGAFYNPDSDVVNVPPLRCFESRADVTATQAYYGVLFHELVHWTMKSDRTGRNRGQYAREELVAELGAVMLLQHFNVGVGSKEQHGRYFQGWQSRCWDREEADEHAKREAAKAVRYILERGMMSK